MIEAGPRRGTRVAIDPAITCGACRPCRDGYRNLCLNIRFAGHGDQDGAMREFLAWPSDLLHPLPDSVTDADGALLEPLGVAIHALDLGHVRLGARVAVIGCGPPVPGTSPPSSRCRTGARPRCATAPTCACGPTSSPETCANSWGTGPTRSSRWPAPRLP